MVEACLVEVEFAAVRGIVVMAGSQLRCDENNCKEIGPIGEESGTADEVLHRLQASPVK